MAEFFVGKKVFTVFLPEGDKKSVIFHAEQPLQQVLLRICQARGVSLDEFLPIDANGQVVPLNSVLGDINGNSITIVHKKST